MRWDEFRKEYVDTSFRMDVNTIKTKKNPSMKGGCSPKHNYLLALACAELLKEEIDFVTECRLKTLNGKVGRPDIVVPLKNVIIEILVSEKEERFLAKGTYYPLEFDIIPVRSATDAITVIGRIKEVEARRGRGGS